MARADFIAKNPNTVRLVVRRCARGAELHVDEHADAAAKFADFAQIKPDVAKTVVEGFSE